LSAVVAEAGDVAVGQVAQTLLTDRQGADDGTVVVELDDADVLDEDLQATVKGIARHAPRRAAGDGQIKAAIIGEEDGLGGAGKAGGDEGKGDEGAQWATHGR
jgi:hypothetical protein